MSTDDKTPHPTDLYVGGRVRQRRRTLGVSQETLAAALGLTFQQVQKYERGANRVSASKLAEIAAALDTPVGWFFEGLVQSQRVLEGIGEEDHAVANWMQSSVAWEVALAMHGLPLGVQKAVVKVAYALLGAHKLEGGEIPLVPMAEGAHIHREGGRA